MAIGRTFKEAFMKAFRSLELGRGNMLFARGGGRINASATVEADDDESALQRSLAVPNDQRMWAIFRALDRGWDLEEIHRLTKIDRWFLTQFRQLVELQSQARLVGLRGIAPDLMRSLKRAGFGDWQLGSMLGADEESVRAARLEQGLTTAYKRIDTCAAEFESFTPYLYGTYEKECEAQPDPPAEGRDPRQRPQPHRPGHRVRLLLRARRVRAPRRRFRDRHDQLQSRDGLHRLRHRRPALLRAAHVRRRLVDHCQGAGGRRRGLGRGPVRRPDAPQARPAAPAGGRKILGTSPDSIDLAEDRERFSALLWELGIPQAPSGTATSPEEARDVALRIGFPLVVRPSYVLGGRAMAIVYDMAALDRYMTTAVQASPERPVLIDKFLEDAVELDVDAVADATGAVVIGGIMEHIEEAGIHSGDSSCVVPPYQVAARPLDRSATTRAASRARSTSSG